MNEEITTLESKNIKAVEVPIYKIHTSRFKYNVPSLRSQPYPLLKPKIITFSDTSLTKVLDDDMLVWGIAKLSSSTEKINIYANDEALFNTRIKVDDFPLSTVPVYQLPVPWVLKQNTEIRVEPYGNTSFNIAFYCYYTKIDKPPRRFPYLFVFDFSTFTPEVMQTILRQCRNDLPFAITNISQNDISSLDTKRNINLYVNSQIIASGDPYVLFPNPQFARRFYYRAEPGSTITCEAKVTTGGTTSAFDILLGGYYEKPKTT